jgi:hypothetical protein
MRIKVNKLRVLWRQHHAAAQPYAGVAANGPAIILIGNAAFNGIKLFAGIGYNDVNSMGDIESLRHRGW